MLDEPTGSYRERIATQARPGRGRWSMVGYAACAVLVLSTLVMGVNSIGSYEKINELQEAVSLIAGNFTQNEAKQAKDNDKTIVTTVDGKVEPLEDTAKEDTARDNQSKDKSETDKKKAKDGENSENKQDVAQNDKKKVKMPGNLLSNLLRKCRKPQHSHRVKLKRYLHRAIISYRAEIL